MVNSFGEPVPDGQFVKSLNHFIKIQADGILFIFDRSPKEGSCLFVKWRKLKVLSELGVWFCHEELEDIPLRDWFGPPLSVGDPGPIHANNPGLHLDQLRAMVSKTKLHGMSI